MSRITELENLIKYHQDRYYNEESEISDEEFDELWDELSELDPSNKVFKTVGKDESDGFEKADHIIPMGSQQKAKNDAEFRKWGSTHNYDKFIAEDKLDGCSIELQYKDGKFIKAVTRGNGLIGDDITVNVRKMKGFIENIDTSTTGLAGVRGEVMMLRSIHKSKHPDKANCRNAANGVMKRKDGKGAEDLTIIVYDATIINIGFKDELVKLDWLKNQGFNVVNYKIFKSIEEIINYRSNLDRTILDYDMDGIVIKGKDIDPIDLAKARPDKQIAFKFVCEEAQSPIIDVEWSTSGNKYTPIGKITPVALNGTVVKQANLCNLRMINDMGIKIGSVVVMTKRGEIIPKIEKVVSTPNNSVAISHPTTCECCGSKLEFTNNLTLLYCPNPNCVKVLKHKLWKWVCMMEIMDIGGKFIDKIVDDGLVKSISDFYNLTEDQIANIDRMGIRSAKKIVKNRDAKLETTLSKFIVGFDIDGIGTSTIDKIIEAGYDSLNKILDITKDELLKINGFGEATVKALIEGTELNRSEMENLSSTRIKLVTPIKVIPSSDKLDGKEFTITGKLSMKRSEFEKLIIDNGGKITGISKTSYALITDDPEGSSSKNTAANKFGIKKISEEEFMEMIK